MYVSALNSRNSNFFSSKYKSMNWSLNNYIFGGRSGYKKLSIDRGKLIPP